MFFASRSEACRRIAAYSICACAVTGSSIYLRFSLAEEFSFDVSFTQYGEEVTIPFSMWLPNDMPTVRGLVFQLAGGCGETLITPHRPEYQRLAHSLGFGLVGQGTLRHTQECFFGETVEETEQFLQSTLNSAAAASGHTELTNAPIALTGFSWGAFNSHYIAARVPSRVVGFAGRRGLVLSQGFLDAGEGATQVPGIFILGAEEPGAFAPDIQQPEFEDWRSRNAQVALAVAWGSGHDEDTKITGASDSRYAEQSREISWYWLSEAIRLRYPEGQFPSTIPGEPLVLNDIDTGAGWLGETPSFFPEFHASAAPEIYSARSYPGDAAKASWLPSEGAANVFRAVTAIADRQYIPDNRQYPGPMRFVPLSHMVSRYAPTYFVGDPILLQLDPYEFDDEGAITEITFFDGDQLIGTDTEGPDWGIIHRPDEGGIRGITAIGTNEMGGRTFSFRAIPVLPSTDHRIVPPIAIYTVADEDSDAVFDGLGDDAEDASEKGRRRVGERDTAGTNKMVRVIAKFLLPATTPDYPVLTNATLRFFVESIDGPPPEPLSIWHGIADNDLEIVAADYEDTGYADTSLNLVLPGDLPGRFFDLDVTDRVLADYAADGDNPLSAFRLQINEIDFLEDDQDYRYLLTTPGAEGNHPELVLTFIPEPSTLVLGALGLLSLLGYGRRR